MTNPSAPSKHHWLLLLNIVIGISVAAVTLSIIAKRNSKKIDDPQPHVETSQPTLPPSVRSAQAPALLPLQYSMDPEIHTADKPAIDQELIKNLPLIMQKQTETLWAETQAAEMTGRTNDPLVLTKEEILELERDGRVVF